MAGCRHKMIQKTEENTNRSCRTMLMPRKSLTAREAEDTRKILQVLIPLKKTVQRQMTQLQKQRVQVSDSASSDSTEADSAEVADSK